MPEDQPDRRPGAQREEKRGEEGRGEDEPVHVGIHRAGLNEDPPGGFVRAALRNQPTHLTQVDLRGRELVSLPEREPEPNELASAPPADRDLLVVPFCLDVHLLSHASFMAVSAVDGHVRWDGKTPTKVWPPARRLSNR